MDAEEILIEAEKLGIRQEVLQRVAELRNNSPYRRDIKSFTDYVEQAFDELKGNIDRKSVV